MKDNDIQKLIDKYLEGGTSPLEERQLALALEERNDLPEDMQAVRLMLGELTLGEAEYDAIMAQAKDKPSAMLMTLRIILSSAAVWLVGLFLYQLIPLSELQSSTKEDPIYYDNGLFSGSTLKDVYTSYQHKDKLISYTQLKQMIYENK